VAEHRLKTWPQFFRAIKSGTKTFEVRKNDRDYHVGDTLVLLEYDALNNKFSGEELRKRVTYMLDPVDEFFGVKPGYVVMALER
jgi:hypothetical protein